MALKEFSDLLPLVKDMRTFYAKIEPQLKDDETFYDLDFAELLGLPVQFKKDAVVLPTAREVVDTAVDHITPTSRRINVPRRIANVKGTEQARSLQRFYEALLVYLERQSPVSPYRSSVKHLATYGCSIMKFYFDQRKRPPEPRRSQFTSDDDFEEAKEDRKLLVNVDMPFTLEILNPIGVYPDPFHESPEWVIEEDMKLVADVKATYPNWPNSKKRKQTDKVEVVEYWDKKVRAVMVDNEIGLTTRKNKTGLVKHNWGTHPYIIGLSGLGIDDSEHRPEKLWVGMLRYIREVLKSESRSFSVADIVLRSSAWPVRAAVGERANEMPDIQMEYGKIHPMPPGVEITDLTPQLPPDMLFGFLQTTNAIISSATAPRVVRGGHQPGISSGFDRQLALGEARLRYASFANSIERMLTELCQKAAIMMKQVKGPVNIASGATQDEFVTVTASNFATNRAVEIKVNVLEPEDEIRKHQDAISLVAGGIISPQTAIRKYFPDIDPDTELGRILAARLLFSPEVMALLSRGVTEKVVASLGLEEILGNILQAAETEAGGTPRRAPNPENAGEEAAGAGSRSDQAAGRELDLRELGR